MLCERGEMGTVVWQFVSRQVFGREYCFATLAWGDHVFPRYCGRSVALGSIEEGKICLMTFSFFPARCMVWFVYGFF